MALGHFAVAGAAFHHALINVAVLEKLHILLGGEDILDLGEIVAAVLEAVFHILFSLSLLFSSCGILRGLVFSDSGALFGSESLELRLLLFGQIESGEGIAAGSIFLCASLVHSVLVLGHWGVAVCAEAEKPATDAKRIARLKMDFFIIKFYSLRVYNYSVVCDTFSVSIY